MIAGAALVWYSGWILFIAIKTQGKITLRELCFEALLYAATATELWGVPDYSPDWRTSRHK